MQSRCLQSDAESVRLQQTSPQEVPVFFITADQGRLKTQVLLLLLLYLPTKCPQCSPEPGKKSWSVGFMIYVIRYEMYRNLYCRAWVLLPTVVLRKQIDEDDLLVVKTGIPNLQKHWELHYSASQTVTLCASPCQIIPYLWKQKGFTGSEMRPLPYAYK